MTHQLFLLSLLSVFLLLPCVVVLAHEEDCDFAANDNSSIIVNVALLQLMPSSDQNETENLEIGVAGCRKAKEMGADIALFPELWNVGYTIAYGGYNRSDPSAHLAWLAGAIPTNSSFIQTFQDLAQELDIAIGITYLQAYKPLPRNVMSLIDRFGNILFTYAKIHTCDWITSEGSTTSGDEVFTSVLNTTNGAFTIGAMICFDRENPETARVNMLKGAELILTPNGCFLDAIRISQFQVRGFENVLGVAMANYPSPYFNGESCAFDQSGNEIIVAGDEEGVYLAQFNITEIRSLRKTSIWGDAFRRPMTSAYAMLCAQEREPSFQLQNAFGRPRTW